MVQAPAQISGMNVSYAINISNKSAVSEVTDYRQKQQRKIWARKLQITAKQTE